MGYTELPTLETSPLYYFPFNGVRLFLPAVGLGGILAVGFLFKLLLAIASVILFIKMSEFFLDKLAAFAAACTAAMAAAAPLALAAASVPGVNVALAIKPGDVAVELVVANGQPAPTGTLDPSTTKGGTNANAASGLRGLLPPERVSKGLE